MKTLQLNLYKGELPLEIDLESIPQQVLDYCLEYGFKQSLSDAGAGEKELGNKKALTLKRLDAFKLGLVPKGGGSAKTEFQREFEVTLIIQMMKKGLSKKDAKTRLKTVISKLTKEQRKVFEEITQNTINTRNEEVSTDFDISLD